MGETLYLRQEDKNYRILTNNDYDDLISRLNYLTSEVQHLDSTVQELPTQDVIWKCGSSVYVNGDTFYVAQTPRGTNQDNVRAVAALRNVDPYIGNMIWQANCATYMYNTIKFTSKPREDDSFARNNFVSFNKYGIYAAASFICLSTRTYVNILSIAGSIYNGVIDYPDYTHEGGIFIRSSEYIRFCNTNRPNDPHITAVTPLLEWKLCSSGVISKIIIAESHKWPFAADNDINILTTCVNYLKNNLSTEINERKTLIDTREINGVRHTRILKNDVLEVVDNMDSPTTTVLSAGKLGGSSLDAVQVHRFLVTSPTNTTGMLVDESGISVSLPYISLTPTDQGVGYGQPALYISTPEGTNTGASITIGDDCPLSSIKFARFANGVTIDSIDKWPFATKTCISTVNANIDYVRTLAENNQGAISEIAAFQSDHFQCNSTGFFIMGNNKPVYTTSSALSSVNDDTTGYAYTALNDTSFVVNNAIVSMGTCTSHFSGAFNRPLYMLTVNHKHDTSGFYLNGAGGKLEVKNFNTDAISIANPEAYPWHGLSGCQNEYLQNLMKHVSVSSTGVSSIQGEAKLDIYAGCNSLQLGYSTTTISSPDIRLCASSGNLTSNTALKVDGETPGAGGSGLSSEQMDYINSLMTHLKLDANGVTQMQASTNMYLIAGAEPDPVSVLAINSNQMTLTSSNINLQASNTLTSNHALSVTSA